MTLEMFDCHVLRPLADCDGDHATTQVRDERFDQWHLTFINHLDMFLHLKF